MKTHSMATRIGALVVAGGLVLGFGSAALAAGSPTSTVTPGAPRAVKTLDTLKQACEGAIDRRLTSLGELQGTVSNNTYLTAGHKATLLGEITAENEGLAALRVKIAGDTDRATLVADCKSIVEHYRVYLLMLPKAHLMIASDASVTIGQKLTDLATKLQAAIDKAKGAGKDVGDAQRDLNNLKAATSAGVGATAPVPTLLNFALPLNPSDFEADEQNVKSARTDMGTAHTNFVQARSDARQVIADLKALKTPKPVTPTATASS